MAIVDLVDQPLPMECGCRAPWCCGCFPHPEGKPWKEWNRWPEHWVTAETCPDHDPTIDPATYWDPPEILQEISG